MRTGKIDHCVVGLDKILKKCYEEPILSDILAGSTLAKLTMWALHLKSTDYLTARTIIGVVDTIAQKKGAAEHIVHHYNKLANEYARREAIMDALAWENAI